MGKDGAKEKIEFHKKGNVAMKYLSNLSDIPEFSSAATDSGQFFIFKETISLKKLVYHIQEKLNAKNIRIIKEAVANIEMK